MKKILFLLGRAFADIVWSCDQAAELCLSDRTFIPEEEICENQTCLNEKTDLCNDHEVFRNGEYGQFFCEQGTRSPNQVKHSKIPVNGYFEVETVWPKRSNINCF